MESLFSFGHAVTAAVIVHPMKRSRGRGPAQDIADRIEKLMNVESEPVAAVAVAFS